MTKKAEKTQAQANEPAVEDTTAASPATPMYDEEPPARFFNGGASASEIEAWKEAHCIGDKPYTEGKPADWKDTEGSDED